MKTQSLVAAIAAFILAAPAMADPPGPDIAATNAAALRGREDASLVGALHEFAWERGSLYAVAASPARITDIALEPGELLLSVSAGDTTRWIVGDARSGAGASLQAHVLVKPNAANLATNLVIMTDRRVYHLELRSAAGPAMASISWRYPEVLALSQPAPDQPPLAAAAVAAFDHEQINLGYRLAGDAPDWRPVGVFDDGRQVFIEMPPAFSKIEAPPLFVSGPNGAEMVNYRVRGNYYIVDRLFLRAELKLGSGPRAQTVKIERTSALGGAHE